MSTIGENIQATGFEVIYQDHHLLVVNKAPGIVVHPTYKHADGTMWDALLAYLAVQEADEWRPPELADDPAWADAPAHIQTMLRERQMEKYMQEEGLLPRPALLHRLDKDTSGLVALARTGRSRRHIVRQFEDRTIIKRYLAVVQQGAPAWATPQAPLTVMRRDGDGRKQIMGAEEVAAFFDGPGSDELVLDGALQRDPEERRRCIVGPDGQASVTVGKVLAVEQGMALLEVRPLTGRTHQIRAHLAALGYAIVGDQVYAPQVGSGTAAAALSRQFLHASRLTLRRYPENDLCIFVAPLASDLAQWLECYFPTALEAI